MATRRRRTFFLGLPVTAVGLIWTGWSFLIQPGELATPVGDRAQTLPEIAIALVVVGILTMIGARFVREDP